MNWIAKLEKTKKELEKNIDLERRKLMMEKEMISFKVSNLEKKIEEIAGLEKDLEEFKQEKNKIARLEEEKISKKRFLDDLNERITKIKHSNEEIEKRGSQVDAKIALLDNPEPYCPICHKEMRYDQKVNAKARLSSQSEHEREVLRRNLEQLKELERKKELNEETLKDIERKLLAKPLVFEKVSLLEEKISETRKEAKDLRDLEDRERKVRQTLQGKSYAPMSQKLLKEVKKEIRKSL